MSIRSKLLLLLAAATFIPATLTMVFDAHLLESLSADLTSRHADALSTQTLATMDRIANDYAALLGRESRRVKALVSLQAREAEQVLQRPPESGAVAHEAADYDSRVAALNLVARPLPSPARLPGGGGGAVVSWSNLVIHPAPDSRADTASEDARRLAGMAEFFGQIRDPRDPLLGWHYVVLENGLSATYPGHGNTPASFDPRDRPWYSIQKTAPRFRWYRPHFDASTGALLINAIAPLHDETGKFMGVTALDVDLGATFELLQLPERLRPGSEIQQVAVLEPPISPKPRLVTIARQQSGALRGDWHTLPDLVSFDLGNREATARISEAMLAGRNGDLRANVDGVESFVLYRRFGEFKTYVLMTVPVAVATSAALEAAEHAAGVTAGHLDLLLLAAIGFAALAAFAAVFASRHVTSPVEDLERAVEQLAAGNLEARAEITSNDEFRMLGNAFNAMVPRLREHARVEESLVLAREVQQQFLPAAAPQVAGYSIAGKAKFSEKTGGDYFDYLTLELPDGHAVGLVIADVSGHGIGPALLMATTRALLHGGRQARNAPGELLAFVNHELADDVNRGHFVTMFVLSLDAERHELLWASAGHDPAFVYDARTGEVGELSAEDIPLAVSADWSYTTHSGKEMAPGDIVVMATDGVWDSRNSTGQRFGKARLRALIVEHARRDAPQLCAAIEQALEDFRGEVPQPDDVTIVILKRESCP